MVYLFKMVDLSMATLNNQMVQKILSDPVDSPNDCFANEKINHHLTSKSKGLNQQK